MKKAISTFLFFIGGISGVLFAQTIPKNLSTLEKAYQSNTMYLTYGSKYHLAGKEGNLFFNTPKVKQLFAASPDGYKEYKQYQSNQVTSLTLNVLGGIASITGLFMVMEGEEVAAGRALIIGGLAAPLISIPIGIKAQKKLNKAVWLRNRDVLYSAN